MRTDYPAAIQEDALALARRERELRGDRREARVRTLRLLRGGRATSLPRCAPLVGYSLRQVTRWWGRYRAGGLEGLLTDKPHLGEASRLTPEAYAALGGRMRGGRVATLQDARRYLAEAWRIVYPTVGGLWAQLHARKARPKTGRRRHVKADEAAQEAWRDGFRGGAGRGRGAAWAGL
jgi:transposase